MPARSPCASLAEAAKRFFGSGSENASQSRADRCQGKLQPKELQTGSWLLLPSALNQALPGAPLGIGRREGHQPQHRKEGARNGKPLVYCGNTPVLGQKEDLEPRHLLQQLLVSSTSCSSRRCQPQESRRELQQTPFPPATSGKDEQGGLAPARPRNEQGSVPALHQRKAKGKRFPEGLPPSEWASSSPAIATSQQWICSPSCQPSLCSRINNTAFNSSVGWT